ncbi:MAG TPA: DUF3417 domain-containing protein [Verrucomicrobiae bacterium]
MDLLTELALDLRWSWNHRADDLWRHIEPDLWKLTHNPPDVHAVLDRMADFANLDRRPLFRQTRSGRRQYESPLFGRSHRGG